MVPWRIGVVEKRSQVDWVEKETNKGSGGQASEKSGGYGKSNHHKSGFQNPHRIFLIILK